MNFVIRLFAQAIIITAMAITTVVIGMVIITIVYEYNCSPKWMVWVAGVFLFCCYLYAASWVIAKIMPDRKEKERKECQNL